MRKPQAETSVNEGKAKIAMSGASGFIGSKLGEILSGQGYEVVPLVRTKDAPGIFYDYEREAIDRNRLAECLAVIHLAGKNIMSGLWTKKVKQEIYDSRVKSTRFIAHSLAEIEGPKILLAASAVGIYGDQSDRKLDESSPLGHNFLAHLCIDWERGTLPAKKANIRVVNMRFGTVLDPCGGMLKKLAPAFKLGLGAIMGSGEQFFSFVTLDELLAQILFVLKNHQISGPVNMVANGPVTNKELTKALATALDRRAALFVPGFILKLMGEQGKMLLSSARVYPRVLLDCGFPFADPSIEKILGKMYAKDKNASSDAQ